MFDFLHTVLDEIPSNPNRGSFSIANESFEQTCDRVRKQNGLAEAKAIDKMERETNPILKRRMQLLIERGIYDFNGIENW